MEETKEIRMIKYNLETADAGYKLMRVCRDSVFTLAVISLYGGITSDNIFLSGLGLTLSPVYGLTTLYFHSLYRTNKKERKVLQKQYEALTKEN